MEPIQRIIELQTHATTYREHSLLQQRNRKNNHDNRQKIANGFKQKRNNPFPEQQQANCNTVAFKIELFKLLTQCKMTKKQHTTIKQLLYPFYKQYHTSKEIASTKKQYDRLQSLKQIIECLTIYRNNDFLKDPSKGDPNHVKSACEQPNDHNYLHLCSLNSDQIAIEDPFYDLQSGIHHNRPAFQEGLVYSPVSKQIESQIDLCKWDQGSLQIVKASIPDSENNVDQHRIITSMQGLCHSFQQDCCLFDHQKQSNSVSICQEPALLSAFSPQIEHLEAVNQRLQNNSPRRNDCISWSNSLQIQTGTDPFQMFWRQEQLFLDEKYHPLSQKDTI